MQLLAQPVLNIPAQDINCGQQISVPITVTNFDTIVGFQFSIQWDPAELNYVSHSTIPELAPPKGNTNVLNVSNGLFGFAYFDSAPLTRMDGDSVIFLTFDVVGNNFTTSTINFVSTPTAIGATQNDNTGMPIDIPLGINPGTLTLVDGIPPTITCPAPIAMTTTAGSNSVAVSNLTPMVSDNCGVAALTYSMTGAMIQLDSGDASGQLFNIGTTTVTYRVNDFQGNDTVCSFDVTVTAGDGGSGDGNGNGNNNTLTVNAGSAMTPCGTTINAPISVLGFDNITDLSFTYNFDATQFTYAGIANFNLNGLDITDFDTSQVSTGIIILNWSNAVAQTVADNSLLFNIQFTSNTSVTGSPVSLSNIAAQQNNVSISAQMGTGLLTLQDNSNPTITCLNDQTIAAPIGASQVVVNNIAANATDDCGAPIITYSLSGATTGSGTEDASGTNFQVGVTTVTYTATDGSGNSVNCSFTVTVNGTAATDFTLIAQSTTASCDDNDITIDINVAAFDSIAGVQFSVNWDPSILTYVSRDEGIFNSSNSTVLYGENDLANGNIGYAWFDFNGQTVPDGTTLFTLHFTSVSGGTSPVIFTDSPTPIEVTLAQSGLPIIPRNEIILTAGSITVSDTENPTIACPANQTIAVGTGETSAVVNDLDPLVLDNCGLASVTYTLSGATTGSGTDSPTGQTFNVGVTTITYIATDGAGNTATCSSTITVEAPGTMTVNVESSDAICSSEPHCVDITVDNFVNGTGIQFSVNWDEFVLQYESIDFNKGLADIFASDFRLDITNIGELGFAWNDNNFAAQTLPDGTVLFTICYSVLGASGNSTISITDNPVLREGTIITGGVPVGVPLAVTSGQFSIIDNTPPVVVNPFPASITQYVGPGACSVVGQFTAPTFTDACSNNITVDPSHQVGATFPIGNTTITYTATDPAGNSTVESTTLTVIDTIAPTLINCPADITVTAGANCQAVANWTAPTATDNCELRILSSNAQPGAVFTEGTNTITYTAEDIYGNQSTCSFVVTVNGVAPIVFNSFPGDLIINAADQQCGANIGWLAPTASGGCNSNTTGSSIIISGTAAPGDFFPVGVTTVTYTAEDNTGQSISQSFTVTVIDNQEITVICPTDIEIQADGTVMTDDGNFINAVVSDSCSRYVLTFNDIVAFDNCSPVSVQQTQGLPSGSTFGFGSTMMEFVLSDTMGNTRTCTFQINITETRAITATTLDSPTCAGSDLRLSVNTLAGGTYQWTGPGGFMANVQNPVIPNAMTQNSGEYVVKVTSDNGCTLKDSTMVGVLSAPTITASGNDLSCTGDADTIRLFASGDIPIQDYGWTGPSGFSTTVQNPIIPNATNAAVGIYTVTGTSSNGCSGTGTVVVGISGMVMPTLMSDIGTGTGVPDTICTNTPFTLTGTAYDGIVNYSWIAPAGAGLPADLDSNVIVVTPTIAGTYTYGFSADLNGNCPADTARLTIVVEDGTGDITLGSNGPFDCTTSTQTIDLTATGGIDIASYVWTGPNGFTSSDQNPSLPASNLASGTYTLVATANSGCTSTKTIEVMVSVQGEAPMVTLSSTGTNICEGDALTFTGEDMLNATYEWVGPNGFTSTDRVVTISNVTIDDAGAYLLRTTVNGCTSAPMTVGPIVVLTDPVATDDNVDVIRNQSLTFNVIENDNLIPGVPFTINLMSEPGFGTLTDVGDGIFTYIPFTDNLGVDQIAYEICYDDCPDLCSMVRIITIRIINDPSTCIVPSLITPNGDGMNDILDISCVSNPPKVGSELIVFNEWGSEVFRESPYQNNWAGTYNGEELPDGTYYYIFKEDSDDNDPKKGYVTIFR